MEPYVWFTLSSLFMILLVKSSSYISFDCEAV